MEPVNLSESSESGLRRRIVETTAWKLSVPADLTLEAPLLVIPTVHPRGDRRILRCAQAALDAGFRIHLLWLGEGEDISTDTVVGESVFPSPRSAWARLRSVGQVSNIASELDGAIWHIHDYYFLGRARAWAKRTGRAVLYDVHEYYADYYSAKVPVPRALQRLVAKFIERYQVDAALKIGGANVVTEAMAVSFRSKGVPTTVSPNFPLLAQFDHLPEKPFAERWSHVLHIGTLTTVYGTQLLVELARRSEERQLPFSFSAIERFPSPAHREIFLELVAKAGNPKNLHLIPPRPVHDMPALLATAGFGLSLLAIDGQNEMAIPSKNYEYVMAGMVDVVSNRAAQRSFVQEHAVGVSVDGDDPDTILDRMLDAASDLEQRDAELREKAATARQNFTWEKAVEPGLKSILGRLLQGDRTP